MAAWFGSRASSLRSAHTRIALLALLASAAACAREQPALPPVPARPSPGCGGSSHAGGVFASEQLQIGGQARTFHLRLPDGYRPDRPYPLIFRFHGYSGDGLAGGLDIERPAGRDAIVIGPDGLNANWTEASADDDLRFFDAMLASAAQRYCVDQAHVYAYGFSAGGGFSNLLACRRADKLRAIAVVAGMDGGRELCRGALAAWYQHDHSDPTVAFSDGEHARDRMRKRNGCSQRTRPEGDCLRYEGCSAPLVWCATRGLGHDIDGERAPERVWSFFRGLR